MKKKEKLKSFFSTSGTTTQDKYYQIGKKQEDGTFEKTEVQLKTIKNLSQKSSNTKLSALYNIGENSDDQKQIDRDVLHNFAYKDGDEDKTATFRIDKEGKVHFYNSSLKPIDGDLKTKLVGLLGDTPFWDQTSNVFRSCLDDTAQSQLKDLENIATGYTDLLSPILNNGLSSFTGKRSEVQKLQKEALEALKAYQDEKDPEKKEELAGAYEDKLQDIIAMQGSFVDIEHTVQKAKKRLADFKKKKLTDLEAETFDSLKKFNEETPNKEKYLQALKKLAESDNSNIKARAQRNRCREKRKRG